MSNRTVGLDSDMDYGYAKWGDRAEALFKPDVCKRLRVRCLTCPFIFCVEDIRPDTGGESLPNAWKEYYDRQAVKVRHPDVRWVAEVFNTWAYRVVVPMARLVVRGKQTRLMNAESARNIIEEVEGRIREAQADRERAGIAEKRIACI